MCSSVAPSCLAIQVMFTEASTGTSDTDKVGAGSVARAGAAVLGVGGAGVTFPVEKVGSEMNETHCHGKFACSVRTSLVRYQVSASLVVSWLL